VTVEFVESRTDQVGWAAALWGRGFRPFFLLAAIFAPSFLVFWLAILAGVFKAPSWIAPLWWHAHEMVFGFVSAAVAGFLLTAVPVWTGGRPVTGVRLGALVAVWAAGRVVMALSGVLSPFAVAVVDLAFLPALAAALAPQLIAARQAHNIGFLFVLGALFAANGLTHLQATGLAAWGADSGMRVGVDLITLLVVVVGGRITPAFTRNALGRARVVAPLRSYAWIEWTAVPGVLLFVVCDLLFPRSAVSGWGAAIAAALLVVRMSGWQSLRTFRDPLVWSLHVGYAWVPVGLGCIALSDLTGWVPWTIGVHALTSGAFGTMILAVMTRVGIGHTGRELKVPRWIPTAYVLVTAGALLRTLGTALFPASIAVILVSGFLWAAAFVLFTVVYWPVLTSPRVDGQEG
jgi:uncharacterized protein involved in response to NO